MKYTTTIVLIALSFILGACASDSPRTERTQTASSTTASYGK